MDGGLIAGYANLRALEQLVEAGWTPLAALILATSNGAELLGVGDQVGRVAVGCTADLIRRQRRSRRQDHGSREGRDGDEDT
jgi:imidazolonepropionase-like amidohydrolase